MKYFGALCAISLLCGELACAQSLRALSQFSVITSGDFINANNVQGRALIGGNLTSSNSMTFGASLSNSTPASDLSVLILGTIASGNSLNISRGSVGVRTSTTRSMNFNGGGSVIVNAYDYSATFTELNQASTALKNTAANSVLSTPNGQPQGLVFNAVGDASGLAVFNINGNSLFSNNSIQSLNFSTTNATDIVFNVSGNTINWNGNFNMIGNFNSDAWRGNIIWNFYEANTINLGNHDMMGQILAPNANVTIGNSISGSIYAKSLSSNGDIRLNPYDGNIVLTQAVPEPAVWILGALASLILLRRKRP